MTVVIECDFTQEQTRQAWRRTASGSLTPIPLRRLPFLPSQYARLNLGALYQAQEVS
jgi:hypothetical protein